MCSANTTSLCVCVCVGGGCCATITIIISHRLPFQVENIYCSKEMKIIDLFFSLFMSSSGWALCLYLYFWDAFLILYFNWHLMFVYAPLKTVPDDGDDDGGGMVLCACDVSSFWLVNN